MKTRSLVVVFVSALAMTVTGSAPAELLSASDRASYRAAFDAVRAGDWPQALRQSQQARMDLPAKVVTWLYLTARETRPSFEELTDFATSHPDWPDQATLRRRAEEAIGPTTRDRDILAWFAANEPLTREGRLRYVEALFRSGRGDEAVARLRDLWVRDDFAAAPERAFLDRYGQFLRSEDHEARLERLLWDDEVEAAKRLLGRVGSDRRALAEARIRLIAREPGVDGAILRVPAHLQNDPGLIYNRTRWRRLAELDPAARELLRDAPAELVRPDAWWTERAILVRRAMSAGNHRAAYEVAAGHGLTRGASFAEAEWLAGWLALRFLDDPQRALRHFATLHDGVSFPISLSRGAYWAGRAAQRAGDEAGARQWYQRAAEHFTTFYGQLAAAELGWTVLSTAPEEPRPSAAEIEAFARNELVRVVHALAELGETEFVRPFILRLSTLADTPGEHALVADLSLMVQRQDLAVSVARRASTAGVQLIEAGYPVLPLNQAPNDAPERALLFALMRQESSFDTNAVSRAGARGLMQLMPGTASDMARALGHEHSLSRLTADPHYNIALGSAYLERMLRSFDGSYVLALAAYNAGPGNVRRWLQANGDPRYGNVDLLDWIEMIPFRETRNYVQRVMESVQVYRHRLNGSELTLSLESDLRR